MRKFLILLDREMKSYFYSPIAYVVLCFFLALMGLDLYAITLIINHSPIEISLIELFFTNGIFWFGFLLIIPLLTMRLYSEEFKLGTIETLMTAPVDDWQVVASKFAGALMFYIILIVPTAVYFVIYQALTHERAAQAAGAYWGSYLILLLAGMFYLSIGCLASVLTRNQIIAAVAALVMAVVFFFTGLLGQLLPSVGQGFRDFVVFFSTAQHVRDFSRGFIDSRPIIFYLTMTLLLQVCTFQVFQYRKWKF